MRAESPEPLHPAATAVSAFRALPGGGARAYTVVENSDGWAGLNRLVRRAAKVGYLRPLKSVPEPYAVFDVLDDNDELIQHYAVPHARAWRYLYRKAGLRVAGEDSSR